MRRALLLFLLVPGCDRPAEPPGATRPFTDWRGKAVQVPDPPKRIVSIAPSTTELLFAVGAGAQVVGITTYCDYPPEARAGRAMVGDIVLDFERLASLRPDLVVTAGSLTRKATADLEAKGYAVFAVDPSTFEEVARALRTLGEITRHPAEGARAAEALLARVQAVMAAPLDFARGRTGPTFYFEHSAEPLGTTGPESYCGDALRRAGGCNIFEGGWQPVDWESVMVRDPEVILIAHDRKEGLEHRAGWKNLKAARNGRVHFVAKEHYVYPTPRLVEGLEEAARLFHDKNP